MSRRALMLCPYWPPQGGPGVQRAVKFARYLPGVGYTPLVVTRSGRAHEDDSLAGDVRTVAVRDAWHIPFQQLGKTAAGSGNGGARRFARLKSVRDWLQVPDHAISWVPFATATALRWTRSEPADVLYTTSPYHSTHLAGYLLKKALGIPWVADFRDPWSSDLFTNYPTAAHRRANESLERRVVENADTVVVVSQGMRRDLLRRFPHLKTPVEVIYNGYDDDDLAGTLGPPAGPPYVIRHMGTLYPDRRPDVFLEGYARFLAKNPRRADRFRVEFYGNLHADVEARIQELRARLSLDTVAFHPYVSHDEALRLVRTSHALLLIPGPGESTVTGKIFEYLAARRPLLAAAPRPSGIDEVFAVTGENPLRVDETADQVAAALERLERHLVDGTVDELLPAAAKVREFSRSAAARQLADIFKRIARSAADR